jgi:hypothetical protein
MRHVLMLGLTVMAVACGGQDSDDVGGSEGAFSSTTRTTCESAPAPNSLEDLAKLDSCQLKAMFESDAAKTATVGSALPDGPHDGMPLCRKDILPSAAELPAGVAAISGAKFLISLLKISNHLDNAFASALWHGKEFTAEPGAKRGSVLNFIDLRTQGIDETTRKSAEAVHFIDTDNQWMVLDYTNAVTGLPGKLGKFDQLEGITVDLITHVYDTARLVNPEKGIYLGMAYLVDEPGKYEPSKPKSVVPSCYFALRKKM